MFKPFGEILDIVALSNYYDKGQVTTNSQTPTTNTTTPTSHPLPSP